MEDIPDLANHFLTLAADRTGKVVRFSDETITLFKKHEWKGNIRELKNVIERALVLTDGSEILPGTSSL